MSKADDKISQVHTCLYLILGIYLYIYFGIYSYTHISRIECNTPAAKNVSLFLWPDF